LYYSNEKEKIDLYLEKENLIELAEYFSIKATDYNLNKQMASVSK
jgi:hypothetical protein